jgi:nucleolar pre-ribosomal-associated protein 1
VSLLMTSRKSCGSVECNVLIGQVTAFQERPQLLQTLRQLRHSIPAPTQIASTDPDAQPQTKIPRLPTIMSLFFAHTLRALASPSHFLYPLASRFLLQRPTFDAADVPMLYGCLYASGEGWKRERGWIVRLIRDGMRSEAVSLGWVFTGSADGFGADCRRIGGY